MARLAGPRIAAAACILPKAYKLKGSTTRRRFSTKTSAKSRQGGQADRCAGVGWASVEEIDRSHYHAGLLAMRRAGRRPQRSCPVLPRDARKIPSITCPQEGHHSGDALSLSMLPASVIGRKTTARFS